MVSRADIEPHHQAIQATHAALNLAYATGPPDSGHPSLVHLVAENTGSLVRLHSELEAEGVVVCSFNEPYRDWGLTAIACYLGKTQRQLLSHLPLWTP